jgi:DNA-binding MarR family transcriptional regulator
MAPERLSHLQRRILAWLQAHEQRTRGTISASYPELVQVLGYDKGNLSHSMANLEAKGLVRLTRTPGAKRKPWILARKAEKWQPSAREVVLRASPWYVWPGRGQVAI